jgi:Protein of unknown function (DUF3617)
MNKFLSIAALFVMCAVAFAAAGAIGLKPGKYSVTTVMSMNGNKMAPNIRSRCITTADLQDPERIFNERFLDNFKPDSNCTEHNPKINGNKVSYDEDCAKPEMSARTVHVEATVSETGYTAVRSVKPKSPRALPLVYTISAKRTGDCAH